jgi:hypothetical protein
MYINLRRVKVQNSLVFNRTLFGKSLWRYAHKREPFGGWLWTLHMVVIERVVF